MQHITALLEMGSYIKAEYRFILNGSTSSLNADIIANH